MRPGSASHSSLSMPDLVEQRRDVLGGLALAGAGLVAEVGGVDPDQVAADLGDLGGGVVVSPSARWDVLMPP